MNLFALCVVLTFTPLLAMKASAQEVPDKPDIWKSAGTRTATPAEIEALIAAPGPALINRSPCRTAPIPWGTGSPADIAAARLVEIGVPAIKYVVPQLDAKEMWQRHLAIEILGRIGDRKVTPSLLKIAAVEKDPYMRQALAESLGMLRDRRAESALIRLAQEGPYLVYQPAMRGLARLHTSTSVQTLIAYLSLPADTRATDYDTHLWQATAAARALPEVGPSVLPALIKLIDNSKTSPATIKMAIGPAIAVGDSRLVPVLLRMLDNPDAEVQTIAVNNLQKWPDARTLPTLIRVLHEAKGQPQIAAGIALATMGTPEALQVLQQATEAPEASLHHAASNACRYIDTHAATPLLLHLLQTGRKDTPECAAYALGNLKERTAIPALCTALGSSEPGLRNAATVALGNFDDANAIQALLTVLQDTSKEVRLNAVRLLSRKNDTRILPAFQRLNPETDEQVRQAIALGIRRQEILIQQAAAH